MHRATKLVGELCQHRIDQAENCLATLAQRRHVQVEHVQTVVEIRTETAVGHLVGQRTIGRHDQPRQQGQRPIRAHRLELPLFDHPQQLGLQAHRQTVDLVQESSVPSRDASSLPMCSRSRR